jgi:hypothetical protein
MDEYLKKFKSMFSEEELTIIAKTCRIEKPTTKEIYSIESEMDISNL